MNRLCRVFGSSVAHVRRLCSPIGVLLTLAAIAAANVAVGVMAERGDDGTGELRITLVNADGSGLRTLPGGPGFWPA